MALVFIPSQLRRLTGGRDRVVAAGGSLGALIEALDASFPGFRARVLDGDDLIPSLAVSIDGDLVSDGLHAAVRADSEVHFVPALGGG